MNRFCCVYVLVSDESDFYMEQTLMSVISLKYRNPAMKTVLLLDDKTNATLIGFRSKIKDEFNQIIEVECPADFNKMLRSRFIKTSMEQYIAEDFLYIDGDTLIADDLSSISDLNVELGAVVDLHSLSYLDLPIGISNAVLSKSVFGESAPEKFYNGGVFFTKKTEVTSRFFQQWHENWLRCVEQNVLVDQPAFNYTNQKMGFVIKELGGSWNCQILFGTKYLAQAKILHYFASATALKNRETYPHLVIGLNLLNEVRLEGLSEKVMSVLKNPKEMYQNTTFLISMENYAFWNESFIQYLRWLYFETPRMRKLFYVWEMIVKKINRMLFSFFGRIRILSKKRKK